MEIRVLSKKYMRLGIFSGQHHVQNINFIHTWNSILDVLQSDTPSKCPAEARLPGCFDDVSTILCQKGSENVQQNFYRTEIATNIRTLIRNEPNHTEILVASNSRFNCCSGFFLVAALTTPWKFQNVEF